MASELSLGRVMNGGVKSLQWEAEIEQQEDWRKQPRGRQYHDVLGEQLVWMQEVMFE